MSDMDQDWKPSGRPTSTMAQAFSASLDSAFSLDSDVTQLSQNVDQKRQQMIIQNRELEALQQKIREAEERLKNNGAPGNNFPQNGAPKREGGSPFPPSRSERTARFFGRDEQRGPQGQVNQNS